MSDYIKREDAIERLSYHAYFYQNDREFGGEEMLYKDSALNEISELPSADVVEVVRCKDCRHWQDGGFSSYCICDGFTHSDDYCSYGERKDEGL